ncbi:MAG: PepSY domain-containing protein [Pseudomonadota bacterium]
MNKNILIGGVVGSLALASAMVGITQAQSTGATPTLTETAAIEIALAQVPGEVQETELEREDGKMVYEVEIIAAADGKEMEVEIDAETGEVLEIEIEDDDD